MPAVALTVARLIGSSDENLAIAQAFAPWGVPLYVAALAILGALLGRRATVGPRRRPVAAACLVLVTGLALHLWWLAPSLVGSAPPAADGAPRLTVMSTNILLGQADTEDVLGEVVDRDVDLLFVQEITAEALARLEEGGIGDLLPHRAGEPKPGATGTMVFSRTPITDVAPIATGTDSWVLSTAGLRTIAVHPAYPLHDEWGAEQELLREVIEAEDPDLVVGDFNSGHDHAPFRAILDTGLRDAAELVGAGWQPTWPVGGFRGIPIPTSVAIDHVLVGERLTALSTETTEIDGADHLALVAEVAERD
ncbi:endonuclease/exonuclease/phosphatase (EEP) superfamily protein YafD [Nocardioides thalensis]|uniref:Endonuclease/exonuclease/phosphatase (EEP) superfamily protein YafD n=1 Tax=Nocardioides thalensis TaxID=1914755 RepID=A0A853BXE0_9ACTN|nr:endonuclease/exonuclease/phosphatase family protein [Nocardioides thalensis]NYJ00590.1 endonuclease/exonuclease/phosphatase (EEP) superfamily protein YafD [Nocardioides thalensis]